MNHVLKTMPDGSEFTVKTAGVTVVLCAITGTIGCVLALKVSDWRYDRWIKKHVKTITPNKK